jgi:hypothetical protein
MQGGNVDLGMQIANHRTIVTRIAIRLGGMPQAQQYLKKCLYYVNIGSNDYINNYYLPQYYRTSRTYNPEQYAQVLINQVSNYLQVYIFLFFVNDFFLMLLIQYIFIS